MAFGMNHPLFKLLAQLESSRIHFTLSRHRSDSVLVTITLVGERVEVDVFDDGRMEVSRFHGTEDIVGGSELIDQLIERERN
jgi:hypothetical protein